MQCVHTQVCVQHFCVCAHHSCVHTHYQLLIYEENAVIFLIPHSNPSKLNLHECIEIDLPVVVLLCSGSYL